MEVVSIDQKCLQLKQWVREHDRQSDKKRGADAGVVCLQIGSEPSLLTQAVNTQTEDFVRMPVFLH